MELRSCYFCGSAGAGLETRTLATDSLAPDADPPADEPEPVSVVLCPSCDTKLDRLLDGLRKNGRRQSDADGPTALGAADDRSEAVGFTSEITFGDAADGRGGADDGGEALDDDPLLDEEEELDDDPLADEAEEAAEEKDSPEGEGADTAPDGTEAGDPSAAGDADSGDSEAEQEGVAGSAGTLRGLGEGSTSSYRQALRLLQNREFPMARSDLVDVMSSAYDLDRDDCERLVDLAVERDWLVEEDGELRRG